MIRHVDASGTIRTVVGTGESVSTNADLTPLETPLLGPAGLSWTAEGDLLIAELVTALGCNHSGMNCEAAMALRAQIQLNLDAESANMNGQTRKPPVDSIALMFLSLTLGCTKGDDTAASGDDTGTIGACASGTGCLLAEDLSYGLLSVQARATDDVWIVGSSPEPADGTGPAILQYDGSDWRRLDTTAHAGAELWWAWIHDDEAVFVGNQGLIVELDRESDEMVAVDGPAATTTFFGVWGAGPEDLWAVGMTEDGDRTWALWRRLDGEWTAWTDPELGAGEAGVTLFKVHGTAADDVWFVGTGGLSLRWNGSASRPLPPMPTCPRPQHPADGGRRPPHNQWRSAVRGTACCSNTMARLGETRAPRSSPA